MRTAHEDLTGRARLRDAAIESFAAHGFNESLRSIAAQAGVTAGLVRHHFGSKEQLRSECDATVLERYRILKEESIGSDPRMLFSQLPSSREGGVLMVYMLRSVQDGSEAGRIFLENMVAEAAGFTATAVAQGLVVPSRDEPARARFLIQQGLGGMIVNLAMQPEVRLDDFARVMDSYMAQTLLPTLELYTEGLFATDSYLSNYLNYQDGFHSHAANTAGESTPS